ncbi:MAG TPA: septum formation initiator family protein [Cyclobacteriaceae bacterium]
MRVKLPAYLKNFYFIIAVFFLIWMLFVDSNDVFSQLKLRKKVTTLEQEKEYYLEKIEEVKKDREELLSNQELLEKFAREKYLMKKKTEDIYLVVEEK